MDAVDRLLFFSLVAAKGICQDSPTGPSAAADGTINTRHGASGVRRRTDLTKPHAPRSRAATQLNRSTASIAGLLFSRGHRWPPNIHRRKNCRAQNLTRVRTTCKLPVHDKSIACPHMSARSSSTSSSSSLLPESESAAESHRRALSATTLDRW